MSDQYSAAEQASLIRGALEQIAAAAGTGTAPQSSVTLSQNSKGATQVEVKCYAADPTDAAMQATSLYESLCARYRPVSETRGVRPDAIQL